MEIDNWFYFNSFSELFKVTIWDLAPLWLASNMTLNAYVTPVMTQINSRIIGKFYPVFQLKS